MIPSRMRAYVLVIIVGAVALAVAVVTTPRYHIEAWMPLSLLCAVAVLLVSMSASLPFAGSISMVYAALFAAVVFSGPGGGGLVGLIAAVSPQEIRERKPLLLMLGNGAQVSIAGMVAGLVYVAAGGQPLQAGLGATSVQSGVVAPITATVAFFATNLLLVSIGVSLKTGMSARETLAALEPAAYWVSLAVLALLGFIMAHLLALGSWLGLLLLVLPFALARRTFRVYLELSEAYTATVRSLVTAIEAKDPYTRGHSERVALLSRALAERTGLPDDEVEIVERAALLHDVGKIGVSVATLTSAAPLTADEVREIRNHPVIGSELLEKVDFLSSIVPIVRHHHEHMDGAGYPDGLSGNEIPLYARLLAAVDAFDAMTSDRAYRPAMSDTEAMAEMVRVAGQQLDPSMVNALSALLLERQRSEVQQA